MTSYDVVLNYNNKQPHTNICPISAVSLFYCRKKGTNKYQKRKSSQGQAASVNLQMLLCWPCLLHWLNQPGTGHLKTPKNQGVRWFVKVRLLGCVWSDKALHFVAVSHHSVKKHNEQVCVCPWKFSGNLWFQPCTFCQKQIFRGGNEPFGHSIRQICEAGRCSLECCSSF